VFNVRYAAVGIATNVTSQKNMKYFIAKMDYLFGYGWTRKRHSSPLPTGDQPNFKYSLPRSRAYQYPQENKAKDREKDADPKCVKSRPFLSRYLQWNIWKSKLSVMSESRRCPFSNVMTRSWPQG
jgi:hypothetical protein